MTPRLVVRAITTIAAGALLLSPALAQTKGGSTGPATGSTGASGGAGAGGIGTGNTGTIGNTNGSTGRTTIPNGNTNPSSTPTFRQPMFISGKVALEDGGPLPQPAVIERICLGNPHAEGYTDTRGNFMIELGNEAGVFQDASESPTASSTPGMPPGMASGGGSMIPAGGTSLSRGGMATDNPYMNCDLRAKLAGFRSQSVSLADRRPMDDPNIGTILLHREGADEGTTISATTLAAPKNARKAFQKGQDARKKHKVDDAADNFARATQLYPAFAEAWFNLGLIQADRRQIDDARHSFEQAIKGDPKFVNPYVELSVMELNAKRWPELSALTTRAIKLDPFDYPQIYLFDAVADFNQKNYGEAVKSIKEAERLDTRHAFPDVQRLYGLVLIQKHDYAGAAEHLRTYLKLAPDSPENAAVTKEITQLEGAVAANKQQ